MIATFSDLAGSNICNPLGLSSLAEVWKMDRILAPGKPPRPTSIIVALLKLLATPGYWGQTKLTHCAG